MMTIRRSDERGFADFGWLRSRHSFSFGTYFDPQHMGEGPLRVINEDRVAPTKGFATHGHRDMEILTYVLDGALAHKDNMGNGSIIRPGDVQRMTAGTGVQHSEYNASATEPVHFLQIWILPEAQGLEPGYEQRSFPIAERRGELHLVASRDGRQDSVTIHQHADLYAGVIDAGSAVDFPTTPDRRLWLQVARGVATLDGETLSSGDGAVLTGERNLTIRAIEGVELLLFDLGS